MIDHLHNSKSVALDDVEILILDEADRLLDEGLNLFYFYLFLFYFYLFYFNLIDFIIFIY